MTNLHKTGAAALIIAAVLALIALFGMTGCKQPETPEPPAPPPVIKHTVTLTQTEGGTVTASPEIPTDSKVAENTVITFTATPETGYKIGKWTVTPDDALQEGGTDGEATAKVLVKKDTAVSVSFELTQAILTVDSNHKTIKLKARSADGSFIQVEGCTVATLESDRETMLIAKGATVILKGRITELECPHDHLAAINVQNCPALQKLDCHDNQLLELNLQGLTTLQTLDCSGNQLPALDLQGLTALQKLDCRNNQLSALNVQNCPALQKLDCQSNQLSALNVQGCASLQELECRSNKLTELNVQGCTALQELSCPINQLTVLNVSGLTALQTLNCSRNQLASLGVQDCTALQKLLCNNNKLGAEAMTKLLEALPAREAGDDAKAALYAFGYGVTEDNYTNFTQPEALKKAFDEAKARHWQLQKLDEIGLPSDI